MNSERSPTLTEALARVDELEQELSRIKLSITSAISGSMGHEHLCRQLDKTVRALSDVLQQTQEWKYVA